MVIVNEYTQRSAFWHGRLLSTADGQRHGHAAVAMHWLGQKAAGLVSGSQSSGHIGELDLTVAGLATNRMVCRHRWPES